ncbi:hypothetical protein GL218_05874 [Daldinia childiae]|uniref:uncharacterized protein n=2 Tax=Daldinia childiae TaxID=326645 RepID=UPI001444C647|nr:uncharacterized protein GL218_05874 [Daldinia childiae]KAF3058167.1 hypothetical protein GL218_05874 [Daldinia childiae]
MIPKCRSAVMEKGAEEPDAHLADEVPIFLPSTFSPWRNPKEFITGSEPTFAHSAAQPPVLPPQTSRETTTRSQDISEEDISNSPLQQPTSPFNTLVAAKTDTTDDKRASRPFENGMQPRTEVGIEAGNSAAANLEKPGPLRRTRFKEMLDRSLPTTLFKSNSFSRISGNYDEIREDHQAAPPHREMENRDTENYPMGSVNNAREIPEESCSSSDDSSDIEIDDLATRYERPPLDCHSRRDVYIKHWSWEYIVLALLSLYSTLLSGLWFITSIYQPRYGRGISSSEGWKMAPSTATLVCTLVAKTIEISFVTVYVALLGQVLTRRAFIKKAKGVTLAEMTMRNWVIQPGSLLTYWEGVPYAAMTILGGVSLLATLCSLFYTTASDALVSPKLMFGRWENRELEGLVKASYANPFYVQKACSTPIDLRMDPNNSAPSCLDVQYSGQSYHNLLTFMTEWQAIHDNKTSAMDNLASRPVGRHSLFDNTTMVSSWIETDFGNPELNLKTHNRIINNVTLAMPHAGVYLAATDPRNDILQPDDLAGVGEYSIRASVVSPVVNVMCVHMTHDELAPLIYTTWPDARTEGTEIPGQKTGVEDWFNDVPPPADDEWLNRTVVDGIFRWGPKYHRRPPVFQLFPIDYNMITNTSVANSESLYVLAKSNAIAEYTLCEMRSWVTPKCSTRFDVSGISGGFMRAHCEDPEDTDSYSAASGNDDVKNPPDPSIDWRNLAEQWRLSMDLNGGVQNNNASNARIMTNFILREAALDPFLPSIAEALAVLSSSTLVAGTLGSTYRMSWDYPKVEMDSGVYETFKASMRTQQYTSSHVQGWQGIFYAVLGTVFAINVACLLYLAFFRQGLVSDYTEPQNLFAVAINSPPSVALSGSCGHGPDTAGLVVPWSVNYSAAANHYFFEEVGGNTKGRAGTRMSMGSGSDLLPANEGRLRGNNYNNYKRLRESKSWF